MQDIYVDIVSHHSVAPFSFESPSLFVSVTSRIVRWLLAASVSKNNSCSFLTLPMETNLYFKFRHCPRTPRTVGSTFWTLRSVPYTLTRLTVSKTIEKTSFKNKLLVKVVGNAQYCAPHECNGRTSVGRKDEFVVACGTPRSMLSRV